MDVNGTRFKMLSGSSDWKRCEDQDRETGGLDAAHWQNVAWDVVRNGLTLKPLLSLFRHKASTPVDPSSRRGAARDSYGNQFWIAHDRQAIIWIAAADQSPSTFWDQQPKAETVQPDLFMPQPAPSPTPVLLAGLAVTTRHYLIVGYVADSPSVDREKGLLLFDLRAGGPPLRFIFPTAVPFEPFDMAADADGGVWILDRTNRAYWGFDAEFRLIGLPPPKSDPTTPIFQQIPPAPVPEIRRTLPVSGFPLDRSLDKPLDKSLAANSPLSIEALPDGTVLILDTPPDTPLVSVPSRLVRYHLGERIGDPIDLVATLPVIFEGSDQSQPKLDLRGYDFTLLLGATPPIVLYVVEQDGTQVIAFDLTLGLIQTPTNGSPARFGTLTISPCGAYLPLSYFGERALITQGDTVYYDVTVVKDSDPHTRWATLQAIDEARFTPSANLETPVFDSGIEDCIWHRLFLDACLPANTGVEVWTRAANTREILTATPYIKEPPLYRRGAGAEIPYYSPFADDTDSTKGTFETVFQSAIGQYLQIELRLSGNGRLTPVLSNLRIYYPRFSYPRQYLPAIYLQDAASLAFLERFMGNPEGFFTDIEGKIENVSLLLDGRSAPPETLDWLAGWLGLTLDPIWQTLQQRRIAANVLPDNRCTGTSGSVEAAPDRRRLLIRFARHLYDRRGTVDGLQFALHLLLDPCLETMLARLKEIAVLPDSVRKTTKDRLIDQIGLLGLPLPTPTSSDTDIEDLLYLLIIAPDRRSNVRIIERYKTRSGRATVAGDASGLADTRATAHRFSVLIPQNLLAEEEAMVSRLIDLEKPAHTQFDVRAYWEGFVVGEARLGIDTAIGDTLHYAPILLGKSALATGFLSARPPMDAPDRLIADRDRVGDMPQL